MVHAQQLAHQQSALVVFEPASQTRARRIRGHDEVACLAMRGSLRGVRVVRIVLHGVLLVTKHFLCVHFNLFGHVIGQQ